MALHGWRLYGVIGLIFTYVTGILILSTINLQTRRVDLSRKRGRFEEISRLRRWEGADLSKRQTVQWCSPLRFLNIHLNLTENGSIRSETKLAQNSSTDIQKGRRETEGGLTALASFPGSGNTWLRYLLQQSTGILTGSIYKDYGLLKSGFPAENISNQSVLVIKTHEWGPKAWRNFDKAILLIRDPDKAILAEFNRQSGGHIGFASPDRYKRTKGRYWKQFVMNKIFGWEMMNLSWARDFHGRLKIVYYDDLVKDVEPILREILSFLNYPIDEEQLSCALMRKEGIYRRKKRLLAFDPYSPAMRDYIQRKKLHVYTTLGRHA